MLTWFMCHTFAHSGSAVLPSGLYHYISRTLTLAVTPCFDMVALLIDDAKGGATFWRVPLRNCDHAKFLKRLANFP